MTFFFLSCTQFSLFLLKMNREVPTLSLPMMPNKCLLKYTHLDYRRTRKCCGRVFKHYII